MVLSEIKPITWDLTEWSSLSTATASPEAYAAENLCMAHKKKTSTQSLVCSQPNLRLEQFIVALAASL